MHKCLNIIYSLQCSPSSLFQYSIIDVFTFWYHLATSYFSSGSQMFVTTMQTRCADASNIKSTALESQDLFNTDRKFMKSCEAIEQALVVNLVSV